MTFAARLAEVRARIAAAADRAGRDPAAVRLIVVTKAHPLERIREAIDAGATLLGENRLEEAEHKIPALCNVDVEWHMIGHLQTRKARRAGTLFSMIHSLDSPKMLAALCRDRPSDAPPQDVLVEVNLSGEPEKHGVLPGDASALVDAALAEPRVRLRGLMTMAARGTEAEAARPTFAALRELRDRLAEEHGDRVDLAELSMGMSSDYEVGVEEGATLVRVGTAIMGPRPPR